MTTKLQNWPTRVAATFEKEHQWVASRSCWGYCCTASIHQKFPEQLLEHEARSLNLLSRGNSREGRKVAAMDKIVFVSTKTHVEAWSSCGSVGWWTSWEVFGSWQQSPHEWMDPCLCFVSDFSLSWAWTGWVARTADCYQERLPLMFCLFCVCKPVLFSTTIVSSMSPSPDLVAWSWTLLLPELWVKNETLFFIYNPLSSILL